MQTYLIADTHFGHENIIKYCGRPFKDVDEMDTTLVKNINQVVGAEDRLIILGDVFLCKLERAREIIQQINCRFHRVILGNHDRVQFLDKTYTASRTLLFYCQELNMLSDAGYLPDPQVRVFLRHKPFASQEKPSRMYRKIDRYSYFFHGHTHNKPIQRLKRSLCVSAEMVGYTPITITEAIAKVDALDAEEYQ